MDVIGRQMVLDLADEPMHDLQRTFQPGRIPITFFHETVRIPSAAGRFRSRKMPVALHETVAQRDHIMWCSTAAVEQDQSMTGSHERSTGANDVVWMHGRAICWLHILVHDGFDRSTSSRRITHAKSRVRTRWVHADVFCRGRMELFSQLSLVDILLMTALLLFGSI